MMEQRRKSDIEMTDDQSEEVRLRQQVIGVRLRQLFDDVVNEPVPDEFYEILRRADQRAAGDQ